MATDSALRFICTRASLALCTLINNSNHGSNPKPNGEVADSKGIVAAAAIGVFPACSARAILVANTIVFQLASGLATIATVAMLIVVLTNVRTKYTAVARREMLDFFTLVLALTLVSLVVDTGIIPVTNKSGWRRGYIYAVALQLALQSAGCWCLMVNGIVVFQLWEDGTRKSVWTLRGSCALMALITFLVAGLTFDGGVINSTLPLFIVSFVGNALYLIIYAITQIVLTVFILKDLWALGATVLSTVMFVMGQVALYGLSPMICGLARHFLDGLFIASVCNMFALIMEYKYWDMITTEDLEFSVNNKETNQWEIKDDGKQTYFSPLMQFQPESNVDTASTQAQFNQSSYIYAQSESYLPPPGTLSSQFRPPY